MVANMKTPMRRWRSATVMVSEAETSERWSSILVIRSGASCSVIVVLSKTTPMKSVGSCVGGTHLRGPVCSSSPSSAAVAMKMRYAVSASSRVCNPLANQSSK